MSTMFTGQTTWVSSPNARLAAIAVLTLALLFAIVFGFAAVTANPIALGIAVGAFLGVVLIAWPTRNVWLTLVSGLLVAGLVPIWADGFALLRVRPHRGRHRPLAEP